jgi:hypothetical protein
MFVFPQLWADEVHDSNIGLAPRNREERRAVRMAKGKPNKGTPKDKRLKRNRRRKKR